MDPQLLSSLAQWAHGTVQGGPAETPVRRVNTDSRALQEGDLFVALRGERHDGHQYLAQAAAQGAAAALVDTLPSERPPNLPLILVPDTLAGLQAIASAYRAQLPLRVVGITGSNGKTSTKDFTAGVLGQQYPVTKTEGNFNNHIGLPLTLLRAGGEHTWGVVEMGMNHPGEIAPLAKMARPEIGIITNIGVAHIEHMGSREAIAQEKGSLAEALPSEGFLVLNADDDFAEYLAGRTAARTVRTGIEQGEVQARNLQPHFSGVRFTLQADGRSVPVDLPVPGLHMVRNALLAVAAGRLAGIPLEGCAEGLRQMQLTKGRLEQKLIRGVHVLDDTYNANPDSMAAALRTLAQLPTPGRRVAVLGAMGELGVEAERGHREVGQVAAEVAVDYLLTVGEPARWTAASATAGGLGRVLHCADAEEAAAALRAWVQEGDIVLVKGSRSARMERVVEAMQRP